MTIFDKAFDFSSTIQFGFDLLKSFESNRSTSIEIILTNIYLQLNDLRHDLETSLSEEVKKDRIYEALSHDYFNNLRPLWLKFEQQFLEKTEKKFLENKV